MDDELNLSDHIANCESRARSPSGYADAGENAIAASIGHLALAAHNIAFALSEIAKAQREESERRG